VSVAVRVLMLSWEYPPLVVGGLGRHVEALARALAAAGHDVRVVTRGAEAASRSDVIDGVRVARSALDPLAIDFTTESLLSWSQAAEHALLRAALPVVRRWRPDVVHAHDWLVAQSAVTLAQHTGAPLVATMHATEAGRHDGWLPRPLNLAIHSVERWLARQAAEVITCAGSAADEAVRLFELDPAHVHVISNGIDAARWTVPARARAAARARLAGDGPLLVYAGRLVHEKGVQTLLDALRPLRRAHPQLRLAVAGTGYHADELRAQARRLRLGRAVTWLGFVAEDELAAVLAAADAVVVPSRYEPFGIVALEAAIAGAPLAVADTGGLRDLARRGVAATSFPSGDAAALAAAVSGLLADPEAARRAAVRARRIVRRDYPWAAIADATVAVYARAR
jgi:glycogen synthase